MAFLVCKHCNIHYEIHSKVEPVEIGNCYCGKKLMYYSSLEEYPNEEEINNEDIFPELLATYESIIARMILYCITEVPFNVSTQKVLDILKGSRSTFILDNDLHLLNCFSIFPNLNREPLEAMVNYLLRENYLQLGEYPLNPVLRTLKITETGEWFQTNGEVIEPFLIDEHIQKRILPYDQVLYRELRGLRQLIASEKRIPTYIVCGNNILLKLARHQPSDPDSMRKIRGIGRKFMEKYSSYFLLHITEYKEKKLI